MTYDSTADTVKHIQTVGALIYAFISLLQDRANRHDFTKLGSPEKEMFDKYTPLLASLNYGSKEYQEALVNLGPALSHHYEYNSHHPENHKRGISGMTLVDIVEMLLDWKAASERHDTGKIKQSLIVNRTRFGLSEQLFDILWNTAEAFDWVEGDHE